MQFETNEYFFLLLCRLLALLFFAILFLQSGLDKIVNAKENRVYIYSVVENSPLKSFRTFAFLALCILELLSGLVCLAGALFLFFGQTHLAIVGLLLCGLSLVTLFFGQRVVKDYAGAASLAAYFAVLVVSMLLFV